MKKSLPSSTNFLANYTHERRKFDVLEPFVRDKVVLEFGLGYSTLFFKDICKCLVSVETSQKMIRDFRKLGEFVATDFHLFNVGPVKAWGYPMLPIAIVRPLIFRSLKRIIKNANVVPPDLVFIDGRFRVFTVLNLIKTFKHDFSIVVDDYYDRDCYVILEDILYKPIKISHDFALFTINDSVRAHLQSHANLPRVSAE